MLIDIQSTVFEALLTSLLAASHYDRNDQAAPVVVLWTDRDEQWRPLLPRLRAALPQLLTLGDYDPATKAGPAIWLRPMIARALPEADWPEKDVPILYLPGAGRQHLRAIEECPKGLQPLAELQYRGAFWTQTNGKDWTVAAFLGSAHGGLGLDLAGDTATADALRNALPELIDQPLAPLRGKRLDAEFLNELLIKDPEREMLRWLDNPDGMRAHWDSSRWNAFRALAIAHYGFDPERDGALVGGEYLGYQQGAWGAVWARFAEAPEHYAALPELLRRATPSSPQTALFRSPAWPRDNETAESDLRTALVELRTGTPANCRTRVRELEEEHAERRRWVWADLGQSPLAAALEHLAILAELSAVPIAGNDPTALAAAYSAGGWRVDAAALDAIAAVEKPDDVIAVHTAIRAIYRPWLEDAAERFQQAAAAQPLPRKPAGESVAPGVQGCCILFADGLRFDVGQKLRVALEAGGLRVSGDWRFAALPSATPTAKPAASPIGPLLGPPGAPADFLPSVLAGEYAGRALTIEIFRKLLEGHGYEVLRGDEVGAGAGMGWCEYGHLDSYGHDQGWRLAKRIEEEVRGLALRVRALLEAGWKEVLVVTDHGWLLLPGSLPKQELPSFLTESRWGRCATLKKDAEAKGTVVPWYWSDAVRIALPSGISCYKAGTEYSHGGMSLQECVVPVLTISRAAAGASTVTIHSVKWRGLRCQVRVSKDAANLTADVRTSTNDPATSLLEAPKTIPESGMVSLPVIDDDKVGAAAVVVVLDGNGVVLAKLATAVGGED